MSQFSASSVAVQKLRLGSVAPKESDLHGAAQALIRLQVASSWTFDSRFISLGTWNMDSFRMYTNLISPHWRRERSADVKQKQGWTLCQLSHLSIRHMTIVFLFSCINPQVECSRLPLHGQALLQRGSAQVILAILHACQLSIVLCCKFSCQFLDISQYLWPQCSAAA